MWAATEELRRELRRAVELFADAAERLLAQRDARAQRGELVALRRALARRALLRLARRLPRRRLRLRLCAARCLRRVREVGAQPGDLGLVRGAQPLARRLELAGVLAVQPLALRRQLARVRVGLLRQLRLCADGRRHVGKLAALAFELVEDPEHATANPGNARINRLLGRVDWHGFLGL